VWHVVKGQIYAMHVIWPNKDDDDDHNHNNNNNNNVPKLASKL